MSNNMQYDPNNPQQGWQTAQQYPPPKKPRRWLTVLISCAIAAPIGYAIGASADDTAEPPKTLPTVAPSAPSTPSAGKNGPATQKPAAKTYMAQDGVYIVGENIAPGTYRAGSDAEFCVWQRYSDKEKTLSTKGTPIGSGPNQLMTVQAGDFSVEVQGCGPWVLVPVKR